MSDSPTLAGPDRLALEVLMKIRSDSVDTSSPKKQEQRAQQLLQTSCSEAPIGQPTTSIMGGIPRTAKPPVMSSPITTTNLTPVFSVPVPTHHPAPLHGLPPSTSASAMTVPFTVLRPAPVQSFSFILPNEKQGVSGMSNTSVVVAPPVPPTSSQTVVVSNSSQKASSKTTKAQSNRPLKKRKTLSAALDKAEEKAPRKESTGGRSSIRRDKIEAALRSKPQRGKKRDNLSVLERMELTRTRNREHAKTTRERKKARYQELLDCEEKLKRYQEQDALKAQQVESIHQFLALRVSALGKAHYDQSPCKEGFIFRAFRHGVAIAATSSAVRGTTDGTESLAQFDKFISESFRRDGQARLQFQVPQVAIADDSSGVGFATVILLCGQAQVMESILKMCFEGHQLASLDWNVISTKTATRGAGNRLPSQQSFPSVVSLDSSAHHIGLQSVRSIVSQPMLTSASTSVGGGGGEEEQPGMNLI